MHRLIVTSLFALAVSTVAAQAAPSADIDHALHDPRRPAAEVRQDAIRAPAETLAFAGVRPGMVVGELFPGGGYFTRMLSDIVGPKGKVISIENQGWKSSAAADQKMLTELAVPNVTVEVLPFGEVQLPEKVDLFWITQNYHDLKIAEYGAVDTAVFNRKVFDALKPGGVYFILDHEANRGTTLDGITKLHRIEKAQVIREVEAAGFKLVGEGSFLHRPGDDHTKSIFDKAIQFHTDQYALKFVRPA